MAIQSVQTGVFNICSRASLTVGVDFKIRGNHKYGRIGFDPNNIFFRCARQASCIEAYIYPVFINVNSTNANSPKELFGVQSNPNMCVEGDYGHCGNMRGNLSECRCKTLDRVLHPEIRRQYEEHVIRQVCDIIGSARGNFLLRLAVYCPGGLLGEEILLFKLFNQLRAINASGVIKLFLIDTSYQTAVVTASKAAELLRDNVSPSLKTCVGNQDCFEQFLFEVCGCLQPSVVIEGAIFGNAGLYVNRAQEDSNFKHDLLISADPDGAEKDMGYVWSNASRQPDIKPITLVKRDDRALVCELAHTGDVENCYVPITPEAAIPQVVYQKPTNSCMLL